MKTVCANYSHNISFSQRPVTNVKAYTKQHCDASSVRPSVCLSVPCQRLKNGAYLQYSQGYYRTLIGNSMLEVDGGVWERKDGSGRSDRAVRGWGWLWEVKQNLWRSCILF